jgi:hypothetical protein
MKQFWKTIPKSVKIITSIAAVISAIYVIAPFTYKAVVGIHGIVTMGGKLNEIETILNDTIPAFNDRINYQEGRISKISMRSNQNDSKHDSLTLKMAGYIYELKQNQQRIDSTMKIERSYLIRLESKVRSHHQ